MTRTDLRSVAKVLAVWVPALLLVLVIAPAGVAKFSDHSGWAAAFRHWGYPVWFRVLIGVLEVAAAACLLWGRTAVFGALLVIVVMLGGTGTHVVLEHGRHVTSEVVPLTLAAIVLVMRRAQIRALRRAAS